MSTLKTPKVTYTISQLFGQNPSVYAQFGMQGHNGVDIVGSSRVYAFRSGDVIETGYDKDGYGNYVKIKDGYGNVWIYAHFAQAVSVRGHVHQWDDLGQMGSTGFSTGVHCHVGVKPENPNQSNGYLGSIDPLPLIQQSINEEEMTQEERDMLHRVNRFVEQLSKGVSGFRQRDTDGALFLDAKTVPDKNAADLEGTVYADTTALAVLMRAAGVKQITKEESKKQKYVRVISARDNK